MAALASVLVVPAEKERLCCGTDSCGHTIIEHGSHVGYLHRGQLLCHPNAGTGSLQPCRLHDVTPPDSFEPVRLVKGHSHGPDCGHDMVPHGDHYDYLVDDRLHHVVDTGCCSSHTSGGLHPFRIVDHGRVTVRQRRRPEAAAATSTGGDGTGNATIVTKMFAGGICCPMEAQLIHALLDKLPGVESVDVMVVTKQVMVSHDPSRMSPAALAATLNGAHLDAILGQAPAIKPGKGRFWPPWYLLLSTVLLLVSILSYIPAPNMTYLKYTALGSIAVGMPFVARRGWAALRTWRLDINVLMVIAMAGAIALGDYVEGASIVVLFTLAEWLEDKCVSRARSALSEVMALQPETARLASSGAEVPVSSVAVDQEVLVRPGDKVPLDGVVVAGITTLDESTLTGETRPVRKVAGDAVMAGTLNNGTASLRVVVTADASSSTVATLRNLVEKALVDKSRTERFVEVFAKYYTPLVLLTALLLALVPSLLSRADWRQWTYLALVVLVTACPCALVISTPVAAVCTIARCARHGVLVKGARFLEGLASVRRVTFDKSGTLTEGRFVVVAVHAFAGYSDDSILRFSAAVEHHSSHPLAAAIIGHAASRGLVAGAATARDVQVSDGLGLAGNVDGKHVAVGSLRLARQSVKGEQAAALGDAQRVAERAAAATGASACYVVIDNTVAGVLLLGDTLRPTAREAVRALNEDCGVRCAMLTGDSASAAAVVAGQVGISPAETHAELLPNDKLQLLQDYAKRGPVAHVGDGVNDAPALAAAAVGVAMGNGGSALAIEAGDVALFTSNLLGFVLAVKLSRRMRWVVGINISLALATKVVVLVFAGMGRITLWISVLADVGSSLLVVLHSLTLLRAHQSLGERARDSQTCIGESGVLEAQARAQQSGGGDCCSSGNCGAAAASSSAKILNDGSPCIGNNASTLSACAGAIEQKLVDVASTTPCCSGHGTHQH